MRNLELYSESGSVYGRELLESIKGNRINISQPPVAKEIWTGDRLQAIGDFRDDKDFEKGCGYYGIWQD